VPRTGRSCATRPSGRPGGAARRRAVHLSRGEHVIEGLATIRRNIIGDGSVTSHKAACPSQTAATRSSQAQSSVTKVSQTPRSMATYGGTGRPQSPATLGCLERSDICRHGRLSTVKLNGVLDQRRGARCGASAAIC
jgi:hypothetical protein